MRHGSKVVFKWIFMGGVLIFLLAACQWVTLKVKRMVHRRDMQEHLEDDAAGMNWQWLVVPASAMEWEEYGKEFWYQGRLYDVMTWQKQDSLVSVLCFEDGKEVDLVQHRWYNLGQAPGHEPAIAHRTLPPNAKYFQHAPVVKNRHDPTENDGHPVIRDMVSQFENDIPYPPPKLIA